MLSLCFSYALSAFSPFFFSFSKSYQQLSMKERNRLCKSSDRRTLFSLKIRFTTIKVLLQAALLWYFSKISFLLQKLLTLVPPWKDFSLQPRILNIRSNLEESYLCDLFLVWICGRLIFFFLHQYQVLCPHNKNQNWDNFLLYSKRSLSDTSWNASLLFMFEHDTRRLKAAQKRCLSTWGVNVRLWCLIWVWGLQILLQELGRELVMMPACRERCLFFCF